VPTVAIQHGSSGDFVLTLNAADAKQGAGKVALRHVAAGVSYNDATVLDQSDLKAGDVIVLDGADKLDDGSAVKIVRN
jgi:membrane fusion protein, multidrug efflux system